MNCKNSILNLGLQIIIALAYILIEQSLVHFEAFLLLEIDYRYEESVSYDGQVLGDCPNSEKILRSSINGNLFFYTA